MLKNDYKILKNGDKVFKSQVIDSYLEINLPYTHSVSMYMSGLTSTNPVTNPVRLYLQTSTGVVKNNYTNNGYNSTSFPATNESSYKKFFYYGNLNSIYSIAPHNSYYTTYMYRGDLIKFMEQFPQLQTMNFGNTYSAFNKNLTNTAFPKTLRYFTINDSTLTGEITSIGNFGGIQELSLTNCGFSKNICDVSFSNLTKSTLNALSSLRGNLNTFISNNPNLWHTYLWNLPLWSGNTSILDVSQLKYITWYFSNTPALTGSMSGWTFNTGLTTMQLYTSYFGGNITNWDFSNTALLTLQINNYSSSQNKISGSLSGWTLPSTISTLYFYSCTGLTSMPINLTGNTNYMNQVYVYNSLALVQDINSIKFTDKIYSIGFTYTNMYGNLEQFVTPTGCTSLQLNNSNFNGKFTGNLSGITISPKLSQLYLEGNLLTGELWYKKVTGLTSLTYLNLSRNTGITFNLGLGVWKTKNLAGLYLESLTRSGITGNFANLVIENNMALSFSNSKVYCDLSNLVPTKLNDFRAYNCTGIYGNLTNWLTGTTALTTLFIQNNTNLSGSTTNWNVNSINDLRINGTSLSGTLKHNNVYYLIAYDTSISSNIRTDFNFSSRAWQVDLNSTNITGSLSGVTLNYGFYLFQVYNNAGITGANHFVNYLFVNRKNWTVSYAQTNFRSIGDNVTGATENQGDIGTWGGSPWDLTEEQINNLVIGTDYTGSGTNTPWNSKQKIWWMKNARVSSTNNAYKYNLRNILYT